MELEQDLSENDFIQQVGNNAVRKAQKESLANGIPNVYSKSGIIYYQLIDGSITMDNPFDTIEFKSRLKILSQK